MYPQVCTKDPTAVEEEARSIYAAMFPHAAPAFVPRIFLWATECFRGEFNGYQAIDAKYHDLEHTLQGTLCLARLLNERHAAEAKPRLTRRMFELGLVAILLHDTGYLKKSADTDGTGAKYTLIHVSRSCDFAAELLGERGYGGRDIKAVQNMIRCTGVNTDLASIPFENDLNRIVGFAVGTADLLGQMAADDYIDKLPVLYLEFAESQRFNATNPSAPILFRSEEDLIQRTPSFWTKYVEPKINDDFLGLYRFLNQPFPHGPNFYVDKIESNIARLRHERRIEP